MRTFRERFILRTVRIWVYFPIQFPIRVTQPPAAARRFFLWSFLMVEHVLMEATPATFKLTREMLNAIDAFGRAESRNRSSAIRQLLKAGLRAKGLVTAA